MKKTMVFAAAAMAMASAFADFSFAYLDTEGAKGETTANEAAYKAYLCTTAAAESFFGGRTGYAEITEYLADNYAAGMTELKQGGTAMSFYDFDMEDDVGVYTLYAPFQQGVLKDGDNYIAVVAYADGADNKFRVFEATASEGTMSFMSEGLGGKSGDWTAAPVPEPTTGVLMLLGLAGLALKRKRA